MHVILNRLRFKPGSDWAEMQRKVTVFGAMVRGEPDFVSIELLKVDDVTGVVMVRYTNRASLDRASSEIAAPWFAENMRQYLDGPADRVVGEVVASG